jgi:7,8-dihydropterin-6-yl-methyl-4-(beta-D-ribofuranosyl)aminobenzene 5'-phosphate synthase
MNDSLDSLSVTVLAEDSVQYESPLWGQHGISLLLEAVKNSIKKKILLDVGQSYEALKHNMDTLGVDPDTIDAVFLTHCHYDHTGALGSLLDARTEGELPVICHPGIFRNHFITDPFIRHVGMPLVDNRQALESKGARFFMTSDPLELMPGLTSTGQITRRTDFEDAGIALKTIENGVVTEDPVNDDISLIARIRNKGMTILTGCSHAGIVNICLEGLELFPDESIEAVIGGFHLVEASNEKIDLTVSALKDLNPGWIYSGHCTGFRAQFSLYRTFGEKFNPLATGKTFTL